MRVGILGGTFNPIHNGHIELARFVLDNCPVMDEVWLMPCNVHPLGKKVISYDHRFKMCKLASEGYQKIAVSDFEYKNSCSYSFEMLTKFKDQSILTTPYMIIGMDEANNIYKWNHWESLIKLFRFIVVDRVTIPVMKDPWFKKGPHLYLEDRYQVIPAMCSSLIRDTLHNQDNQFAVNYFLNSSVLSYIKEHRLYESIS